MKKLEDEVRQNFHIFFIAHQLHKDVDEILEWDYEKLLKWTIYFKILAEEQRKAIHGQKIEDLESKKQHLFVFR